jgi:undecaprenyl-phosphate 4-deoxy-4-formamido-L-arabinose transferase
MQPDPRETAAPTNPPERPFVSVVVPVYNEVENVRALFERLVAVLDDLGRTWELVFTDDGSRDGSLGLLLDLRRQRPDQVRVIEFSRNFGQHAAILAAFRQSRGRVVITIDADMQDPPEEIPKLVECFEKGHDVVGGYRLNRQDSWFRRWASHLVNAVRARTTALRMRDQGCMLRAYSRDIVDLILGSNESNTFIPALGQLYASNPAEVPVRHQARAAGKSKYNLVKLIQLNFDLVTGFTTAPLRLFSLVGFVISAFSAAMVVLLALRRLFVGPEVEGVFTLLGILFFLVGVCITGIGIMGEYLSRIYHEVRRRPPYVIKRVHEGGEL